MPESRIGAAMRILRFIFQQLVGLLAVPGCEGGEIERHDEVAVVPGQWPGAVLRPGGVLDRDDEPADEA